MTGAPNAGSGAPGSAQPAPSAWQRGVVRTITASAGQWVITASNYMSYLLGATVAVLWVTLHPRSWNRTVRDVFFLQCYFTGNQALPLVLVSAVLCSFGTIQLLRLFIDLGSPIAGSEFLWKLMVRDFAPGLMSLIILGRSGTAITSELGLHRITGLIPRAIKEVNPIRSIILPRAVSMALMSVLLGTVFLIALVGSVEIQHAAIGQSVKPIRQLVDGMISPLTYQEAFEFPLKTALTGLLGGIICAVEGLRVCGTARDIPRHVARAFSFSVVLTALVQVAVALAI